MIKEHSRFTSACRHRAIVSGRNNNANDRFLTHERFFHTNVFVDDYSDSTCAHHTKSTDVEAAVEAKHSCERDTCNNGKQVCHYHAENGTFSCEGYKDAVYKDQQKISYCGVGDHFQNGKTENRIKNICSVARTMIINAMYK